MNKYLFLLISESANADTQNNSINIMDTLIKYIILILVIFITIILIFLVRRKFKKDISIKKVKSYCLKAKKYINKIKNKTNKKDLLLSGARLTKLVSLLTNATWIMECVFEERKEVVLFNLVTSLDSLSTYVYDYVDGALFEEKEYLKTLKYVDNELNKIIKELDKH